MTNVSTERLFIMKNLKRVAAAALALTMAFSLAACGGSSTGSDGSASGEKAVYKAALEPTFPPFDTTTSTGELTGLDVDLINAIAEEEGFEVTFENLQFDSLIPALQSGNIDIIASGMSINDERLEQVDFSDPYYDSGLAVAVTVDNKDINGIDDLTPDMKVAVQIGTTGAQKAQELKDEGKIAECVVLNGVDNAMMQLTNGDVQAVINDKPVTEAYIAKQPDKIKIVGDTINSDSYGFAVQKGNSELLEKLNDGLKAIMENGTYDELVEKWFSEGVDSGSASA